MRVGKNADRPVYTQYSHNVLAPVLETIANAAILLRLTTINVHICPYIYIGYCHFTLKLYIFWSVATAHASGAAASDAGAVGLMH